MQQYCWIFTYTCMEEQSIKITFRCSTWSYPRSIGIHWRIIEFYTYTSHLHSSVKEVECKRNIKLSNSCKLPLWDVLGKRWHLNTFAAHVLLSCMRKWYNWFAVDLVSSKSHVPRPLFFKARKMTRWYNMPARVSQWRTCMQN